MKLMKIDISHIAKLANLPLSQSDVEKFGRQLDETITYINQLQEVDTKNCEPTYQVTGLVNVTRDDEVSSSLTQEEALKNAKFTKCGFFKVPAILKY